MKKYTEYKITEQMVYVIADMHGVFERIIPFIENTKISNCIIIVAGDCGLGFNPKLLINDEFHKLNEYLKNKNINIFLLRGNHDDPSYFNEYKVKLSNFQVIKDYSIISIYYKEDEDMIGLPKNNILCIGGAISIDRLYRTERYEKRKKLLFETYPLLKEEEINSLLVKGYWEDEIPIYDEEILNSIKNDNILIDTVVTHTCPSFCFPTNKDNISYWLMIDTKLEDDLNNERKTLSEIYNKLSNDKHPFNKWIYGHYHYHNEETINGVRFTALSNFDAIEDFIII